MANPIYDIYGMGNALVDIEYRVNDNFLEKHGLEKRRMKLVDENELLQLTTDLDSNPISRTCGGSVANTLYAMKGFGRSAYMNFRVAGDHEGHYFTQQLREAGIQTNDIDTATEELTGQCLILITPDAERTMNTHLGVSNSFSTKELSENAIRQSKNLFIEGYLASSPSASQAAIQASELAHAHAVQTNLTVSDTSMVHGFGDVLEEMIGDRCTRLFANYEEACALCDSDSLDVCLRVMNDMAEEVVITMGELGCAIRYRGEQFEIPAVETTPTDLNGAGDMFTAAYLAAISEQEDVDRRVAAKFACYAASHQIVVEGARLSSLNQYQTIKHSFEGSLQTESVNQTQYREVSR